MVALAERIEWSRLVTVSCQQYLRAEFTRAIDYARKEFHMTYEEVIGTLAMMALDLYQENITSQTEDADDGSS